MTTPFSTEQTLTYDFTIADGRGRPAPVDGMPLATSSDETVMTAGEVTQNAAGGYEVTLASVTPGTARLVITADANLSPNDVTEVMGFDDVEVTLDPRSSTRIISLTPRQPVDEA